MATPTGEPPAPAIATPTAPQDRRDSPVARNTFFLLIAQLFATPVSMAVNAVIGRRLGPEDFGYIYLATTYAALGFTFVEWGQGATIPAMIARRRDGAGAFVGSGLALRGAMLLVVYPLVAAVWWISGYGALQDVLALVFVGAAVFSIMGAGTDAMLGLERTEIRAMASVAQPLLMAAVVVPTVLLGGGLRATLVAAIAGAIATCALVWRAVSRFGLGRLSVRKEIAHKQLAEGGPFLALGLVLTLQPSVDALLFAKLGTAEAIGWHSAARKLVGALVFPGSALASALYPTLCRVVRESPAEYRRTVNGALRATTLMAVPLAVGAAIYADVGIAIFSEAKFGPARDNLRVLCLFIPLCYVTMVLGAALSSAGRQRSWAVAQFACVAVSALVDPVLIPWFQGHAGNGGIGVCVATVLSEILMVWSGIHLLPAGIFDRAIVRCIALAGLAGGAMVATARALSSLSPFVAAPLALAAYVACLLLTGALEPQQIAAMRRLIAGQLRRFRRE